MTTVVPHRGVRITVAISIVVIGVNVIRANEVTAADWGLTPALSMEMFYDDNLYLTTQNKIDTRGSVVNASFGLSRNLETTSLEINQKLVARHYDYDNNLDRNDGYTNLAYTSSTERLGFSLKGIYSRESTLTSELADTGRVDVVRKVSQTTLSPALNYELSQRSSLRLAIDFLDKNYDAPSTEFADYSVRQASAQYTYILDEPLKLQSVVTRSKVDVPDGAYGYSYISLETQTDNYQLGLIYDYTENINLSLLYGKRESHEEIKISGSLVSASDSNGATYDIALTKKLMQGSVKLQATRDYSPAGNGVVYETDSANLAMLYRINERHSFNLDATYFDQKPGTAAYGTYHRNYFSIQPGYRWRMSENWSLSTYYRYVHQKYDNNTDAAESKLISVSVAYSWPYFHF